ncbi:hypothetical protein [Natrinema altunense]|uniref:hypothetical protein n=1 Tax=Natrinema altunense TaxID=222984 RepID=UPI000B14AB3B|nr:hypothetical protein [Natrinema altunense]
MSTIAATGDGHRNRRAGSGRNRNDTTEWWLRAHRREHPPEGLSSALSDFMPAGSMES